jgi:hypothetical protein
MDQRRRAAITPIDAVKRSGMREYVIGTTS